MTNRVTELSVRIKEIIKSIPYGRVATYGQIAARAGNPRAARLVVWILCSSSSKESLPWHRVINRKREISLISGEGYEQQRFLLEKEGVQFVKNKINLDRFLWREDF
jgi:methylated-DNA-protein-cysteine methyltransferase-like protein